MFIAKHFNLLTETEKHKVVSEVSKEVDADVMSQADKITKGKHCYNYVKGNIFNLGEQQEIEEAEKVPVNAPEGIVKLSGMMGQIMRTAKTGVVVGNGPEDAAPAELRNAILEDDISVNSWIERVHYQVTQDVLVTGCPTWAFVENTDPNDINKKGLSVSYCPWDSVIPYGGFRDPNQRDLKRLTRIMQVDYEELSRKWFNGQSVPEIKQYEQIYQRVASRESISADFLMARTGTTISSAGMINVFETLRMVYAEIKVSMGQDKDDVIHLPLDWTDEQIQQHIQETGRHIATIEDKVLWSTIWTNTGLLLDHGPHWYQAGGYNAACFIPAMADGEWHGIIEFTLDTLKMMSYLYTEQLQGVRTVNNNVITMLKGAVSDKEQMRRELARAGGIVELNAGFGRDAIGTLANQRENQAFLNAINSAKDLLDRLTLERNAEGGSQASQESSRAIGARVDANLVKMSYFTQGLQHFKRQLNRILVNAMPYGYPTYRAVRLKDPNNGDKVVGINQPAEYDWQGNVVRYVNDISLGDWDWVFTETDNSVSGQEQNRAIFSDFMKNFGNMPPDYLEMIALNYPSTAVQAMGQMLKQSRIAKEQSPPPPPPSKVSFTADLSALGMDALQQIAVRENLIQPPPPPPAPQQGPGGNPPQGQPPQGMPSQPGPGGPPPVGA